MTTTAPEWFEEAVALKAQGASVRAIANELSRRGYENVSPANVWLWATQKGTEQRERMQRPEYKAKARAIAREHYRKHRS